MKLKRRPDLRQVRGRDRRLVRRLADAGGILRLVARPAPREVGEALCTLAVDRGARVLKTMPCSAAALRILTQSASCVVALGGSASSKRAQMNSKTFFDTRPARMPMMIPKGL